MRKRDVPRGTSLFLEFCGCRLHDDRAPVVFVFGAAVLEDLSDWDSSMIIAQGVANDDPRVYMPSSMHEQPWDAYALYLSLIHI